MPTLYKHYTRWKEGGLLSTHIEIQWRTQENATPIERYKHISKAQAHIHFLSREERKKIERSSQKLEERIGRQWIGDIWIPFVSCKTSFMKWNFEEILCSAFLLSSLFSGFFSYSKSYSCSLLFFTRFCGYLSQKPAWCSLLNLLSRVTRGYAKSGNGLKHDFRASWPA
jgi:hypothetical protein